MEKVKTILVRCTFEIPVEVSADKEYLDNIEFHIEENHCPGTGDVGVAFDKNYIFHEKNRSCWACALRGKNEIIDYDYKAEK